MVHFRRDHYSDPVRQLLAEDRLCELGPGTPHTAVRAALEAATPGTVAPNADSDELAACCLSGLWLWHNFLDESHQISQDLHSAEGSYWHGIMHRREPDYPNAKYWYRRVGDHPIFPELLRQARSQVDASDATPEAKQLVATTRWDPFGFVDLCEEAAHSGRGVSFCREVATIEWFLLFDYCCGAS